MHCLGLDSMNSSQSRACFAPISPFPYLASNTILVTLQEGVLLYIMVVHSFGVFSSISGSYCFDLMPASEGRSEIYVDTIIC
jgi:hypothetical protein